MIEEVLAEIAAAEEQAAQIIADAQNKAREIDRSATAESEALTATLSEETKRAVREILAAAEHAAEAEAAADAQKAQAAAQNLLRAAEKNVRGAGEWLAEQLTKGRI